MKAEPDIKVVVVTGGPCAGKSTYLPLAKQWLEDRGCTAVVLPEAATELIGAGFSPVRGWEDPLGFQEHLFGYIQDRRMRYGTMLLGLASEKPLVLLCDRGEADAAAYVGREGYAELCSRHGTTPEAVLGEYDLVVCLESVAVSRPDVYEALKGSNVVRRETAGEAAAADRATLAAWLGHNHLTVIDNSTDWAGKLRRALAALARVLHLPEPLEVERKFLVDDAPSAGGLFPFPDVEQTTIVEIEQTYLVSHGDTERRVRLRVVGGGKAAYYYTEKRPTDLPMARVEHERQIDREEYDRFLRERDPAAETIRKVRRCFVYKGRHFEYDIYGGSHAGLRICEVEVAYDDRDRPVEFPPGWRVVEVTGKREYSNRYVALGSLRGLGAQA